VTGRGFEEVSGLAIVAPGEKPVASQELPTFAQ